MQREGKSVTELGLAQYISALLLLFFLPITVLITIITVFPYCPPCPFLEKLSLPSLLDRKFMFLLCNVILILISGRFLPVIKEQSYSQKKLDVYDEYIMKKNELSLTQVSNTVAGPKSPAAEMGSSKKTGAEVLNERKRKDAERERNAARSGEKELILDGLEKEVEKEHLREEDRRFDEFIASGHDNWRREHRQLLNSKA